MKRLNIMNKTICPSCFSSQINTFYIQPKIPVINNIIYKSKKEALSALKADVVLAECTNCAFIFNKVFCESLLNYNSKYNNSRIDSPYYNCYVDSFIELLTSKLDLKNKKLLEIGCGQGEFLVELCKRLRVKGFGFDPAYQGKKYVVNVSFIADYFSSKYKNIAADVCIMRCLLEHIEIPVSFLRMIINNVIFSNDSIFIIEVPDFQWIIKEGSYWDITYEHCNYFIKRSLHVLFSNLNMDVIEIIPTFGGQYLTIIASYKRKHKHLSPIKNNNKSAVQFIKAVKVKKNKIKNMLVKMDGSFVIWGAGGKGVIFLNTLPKATQLRVPFIIDINKDKENTYCPGTGHIIRQPSILNTIKVNNILIMNSNYYNEIRDLLKSFNRKFNLFVL
jgi:hypothetical protein